MTRASGAAHRSVGRSRVAVVISHEDGHVLEMNQPARELFGAGVGRRDSELIASGRRSRGLPCHDACTARVVRAGLDEVVAHRVAIGGEHYDLVCAPTGDRVVAIFTPIDTPREDLKLTAREVQVLRLLAHGLTVPEAATSLDISAATVRTHVEHMRTKLGVATQAALVARGHRAGYLP